MKRLALIDDDIEFSAAFSKRHQNFAKVESFTSARAAFQSKDEIVRSDALLIDIHLQDQSGFALLDSLREHCKYLPPALFYTEDISESTKLLGLRMGVSDFLLKSMGDQEVQHRVTNAILARKAPQRLVHGNLTLDIDRCECLFEEVCKTLTRLEMQLLIHLLKAGRSLLKKELEQVLWAETITVPNALNTHISNLNKKLSQWDHFIKVNREGWVQILPRG